MSERITPPFRAEHVGSLLRPPEIKKARADLQMGRITASQLRSVEDEAVRKAVRLQETLGFQLATDGEIRRNHWHSDFIYQIGGIRKRQDRREVTFHTGTDEVIFSQEQIDVASKIALEKTIFGEDFGFLRSAVSTAVPKITIPSINMAMMAVHRGTYSGVYARREEVAADMVRAYANEISGLAALGCTYLQIDDVSFSLLCNEQMRNALTPAGTDPSGMHLENINLFNESLRNRPPGMTICTHTCRGNFRSGWITSGGYDSIAEPYFGELAVDGFFLEYDDERSGSFEPLRFVPKGKMVVLGIVSSKRAQLESKDELKRRINEAAKYIPIEQLCLSPQCGFASTQEGNALTRQEQEAKLRLVVETARQAWG